MGQLPNWYCRRDRGFNHYSIVQEKCPVKTRTEKNGLNQNGHTPKRSQPKRPNQNGHNQKYYNQSGHHQDGYRSKRPQTQAVKTFEVQNVPTKMTPD